MNFGIFTVRRHYILGWIVKKNFLFNNLLKTTFHYIYRDFRIFILKDHFLREAKRWFADEGDTTLRLNYPDLGAESIVFDVGGFEGDFASAIFEKYGCYIFIFEPHPVFYQKCVLRFAGNKKIRILNYGLDEVAKELHLTDAGDSSSSEARPQRSSEISNIVCQFKSFDEAVNECQIDKVDLIKINIEGAEYRLLDSLLCTGQVKSIKNLQVQFHDFVPNARVWRAKIRAQLAKTHDCRWCYEFIWESWDRKK